MGKNKNKLPDIPRKEQIVKFFDSAYIPKLVIACFVALMCGLRIREVCRLLIADIDLERRIIKIRDSKNPNRKKQGNYGKDRIGIIPECAVSPIKKWLDIVQGGKWFLPSEITPDNHLKPKTLSRWFSEARARAGLNQIESIIQRKGQPDKPMYKFRFHSLRHFYATYVYEKTRDLYAVGRLLGHNRIDTTTIYAKCSDKVLKESVDFSFNVPVRTQVFEQNPVNAINYHIPQIAKRDKKPIEILEERFARGEISAVDFQTAIRLLKVRKDYLDNEKPNNNKEVETD